MAKKKEVKVEPVERAAILLASLGEEAAAEVFKYLGPKQVTRVSIAMTEMKNISREQAGSVLSEFRESVENQTAFGVGTDEYLRSVLVKALGTDKASSVIDRVMMGEATSGLEQLKWMDPRAVAEVIRLEHPQIIAVVLSYLDPEMSVEVLMHLQDKVRVDVLLRIATLDRLQPSALSELNQVIEKQFAGNDVIKSSSVGGIKTTASIMNLMDATEESSIMEQITEYDVEIAESIQELMFVFDDLGEIDDRGMQQLLREISSETLVVALKGADEDVKAKIFSNMSKRASEMLQDDLEARGPVRLSEVEAAQKEILAVAKRLSDAGEISLGGSGGEEYV